MTGMKEGAGEDPFAQDDDSPASEPPEETEQGRTRATTAETSGRQQSRQHQSMQIPYKYRRDGVQDGRDRVPLFLHADTKSAEREALRELEERFDDDVSLTDLREALVKVGLQHLDEVEEQMEAWGYGLTFDE